MKRRVPALRGKREFGAISSAEYRNMTTACLAMLAVGNYVPPITISPRTRLTEQLKKGVSPEILFCGHVN